jgi:hypothetical protein
MKGTYLIITSGNGDLNQKLNFNKENEHINVSKVTSLLNIS